MDADLDELVGSLRSRWEERPRSPLAKFFIASHGGWQDGRQWETQAETDARFLLGDGSPAVFEASVG